MISICRKKVGCDVPVSQPNLFHLFPPVHRRVRNMKESKMKIDLVGCQPGSSQWESLFLLDSSTCKVCARVSEGNELLSFVFLQTC